MLDAIDARRTLLFATDYPHWDGDYVPDIVLKRLAPEIRDAVAFENALALYGLPATRPGER
jgi:predicted TIM-barrel fold metal-dependent hydrolase